MNKVVLLALICAILALSLDQLSKLWVVQNLQLGQKWIYSFDWIHIVYAQNPGAAFGFFSQYAQNAKKIIFFTSPLVVIGFAIYFLRFLVTKQIFSILGIGLLVGGAIGNFADRIRFGFVIDFIAIQGEWFGLYWPIFNLADSFIVVGVFAMVKDSFKHYQVKKNIIK